ncbi:MAG: hypothetical protein Q8M78_05955, partial [Burkholderiaceae bacterium]|nr:hypothetical protein [Burkholderiaceae bacterium]
MKTPVLQALTASIWAAGLLTAPLLGAQTAVTKGVSTSTVAAAPLAAGVGTDMANVGASMDLII